MVKRTKKEDRYGFVYIWRDRKKNRYYIGSHWGTEDDGYICSSKWMQTSYYRRTADFKRRILKRIYTERFDLLVEEKKWLDLIPDEELGKKYYNKIKYVFDNQLWSETDKNRQSELQKSRWADPEYKKKTGDAISKTHKKIIAKLTPEERKEKFGHDVSAETRAILREYAKKQWENYTPEQKQAHADRCRTNIAGWSKGFTKETHPQLAHTDESKEKIRQAGIGRKFGEEFRNKIRIRMLTNNHMKGEKHRSETLKKMSFAHLKRWQNMTEDEKLSRNKKISIARTGMKFTEDHCKNISLSRIGKYTGKDNPFYGKQHSKDSIEKMLYTRSLRLDNKSTLKGDNRTEAQRAADIGQRGKPKPKRKVSCSICFRLINSSNIGRHETFCMKQHNLSI